MADEDTRYHGFDNLRAIMMWLGIVIHVAMNYTVVRTPHLPWHDERSTRLADLLAAFIHVFRMPVFFVIAGFLAAMLLQRRGPRAFLRHRALRLALPFAVFWPLVIPVTSIAALLFLNRMAFGRWSLEMSALPAGFRQDLPTMHLWFLWMLVWFCVATALCSLLPRAPFAAAGRVLAYLGRAWWGFAVLGIPVVIAGLHYERGVLIASGRFAAPWDEWLHNVVFFLFGLALWAHRDALLPHYRRHWRRYGAAALAAFVAALATGDGRGPLPVFSAIYNAQTWLWCFAWIGFGLVVLDRRHPVLAYLADSAYWVYLVHLPITVLIAAALYMVPLPVLLKMGIGLVVTTIACLASYELFVRHTWISVLLNGKRHARRGGPPATPAAAAG